MTPLAGREPAAGVAVGAGPGVRAGLRRSRRRALALADATRLRLWTGLVLFAFAATHLLNHAVGLVSLDAMEAGRRVFAAFWRATPAEATLAAALVVHVLLAFRKVWERRSLRMSPSEVVQLATGLLIPLWLTAHVLGTGILHRLAEVRTSYAYVLDGVWPDGMVAMTVLVALVWLHGCVGVHRWLDLKPWYRRRLRAPALALALLLPTVSLLGAVSAGREYADRKAEDPAWATALAREQNWPSPETRERLVRQPERGIVEGFQWLVLLLFAARGVRALVERRRNVRLTYPGGRVVSVPRGMSVLEASRARGVPHASVCGGRGRCSTCRVRVGVGADALPPPAAEERRVLARIKAAPDVRLACQIRPVADLAVTPLTPIDAGAGAVLSVMDPRAGAEREIAVLFADLRAFTRLSEGRLPYDTVFVLNRYFGAMGAAVERAGGRVDKFIGDGIMALFGLSDDPRGAARGALAAARAMGEALAVLNRDLAVELDEPLRMGIGVHLGHAIVGEMGYGRALSLTAIGDTVNVASRLETATKELGAELVLSDEVRRAAGLELDEELRRRLAVRGRRGELAVWALPRVADLPALAPPPGRPVGVPRWPGLLALVRPAATRT